MAVCRFSETDIVEKGGTVTVAIAIRRALDGLLVPSGTNQTVHVGLQTADPMATQPTPLPVQFTPRPRTLFGRIAKALRSQEQIAHLSRWTVCTIRRLEAGQPSSLDTRLAVAGHNRLPRVAPSSKIMVSKRVKMGW